MVDAVEEEMKKKEKNKIKFILILFNNSDINKNLYK